MRTRMKMFGVGSVMRKDHVFPKVSPQLLCALVIICASTVFLVFQQIYIEPPPVINDLNCDAL